MYLTPDEEKSLSGENGEALQAATSLLVDVGEFFNAEKLIPVASAHISGVSYLTGGDGLIDQLELFVNKGAKVSVPSTLNPCGMDRKNWEAMFIDLNFATKQFRILQLFEDLDVATTCSCTPYDYGHLLSKGQHVAWAESSAVAFANSFFGARTNKEDSLTVLSAAIVGKTPYYGFHLTEERKPNVEVMVETNLKEYTDYSILGEITGKAFKKHSFTFGAIPVFKNIHNPRPQEIKALGAALASFGTQLFHIVGVTPEQELISQASFEDKLTVTNTQMNETLEEFMPPHDTNIAVIGCPNANLEEIKAVTNLVKGRKLKEGKEFWLFSSNALKAIADSSGYLKILNEAGVKFIVDTCPEVMPYNKMKFKSVLTNSVKAQHYISAPSLNGLPTYILPLRKCVEVMFQ
ncbi:MAG: aconitase X [Candidatus Heimdallarchaeota archaeon]